MSNNYGQQIMTTKANRQLRVTLDSIRNSCGILKQEVSLVHDEHLFEAVKARAR